MENVLHPMLNVEKVLVFVLKIFAAQARGGVIQPVLIVRVVANRITVTVVLNLLVEAAAAQEEEAAAQEEEAAVVVVVVVVVRLMEANVEEPLAFVVPTPNVVLTVVIVATLKSIAIQHVMPPVVIVVLLGSSTSVVPLMPDVLILDYPAAVNGWMLTVMDGVVLPPVTVPALRLQIELVTRIVTVPTVEDAVRLCTRGSFYLYSYLCTKYFRADSCRRRL
jgi:hypothetical protein